ncbi:radical SAM family heme chaperone HemW [Wolinella succinogenes]|uniref:Heme chaperone HemW n=1 Tax=Wolinella succinogenes (strain ATCC 29543 / DSM 1740 / CCUG 13145 / JCM 31913 / LMG 7466 / NCTC 11488 / FDC 602W) TaxID=273121 RepID=Q7M8D2_WOLSU|nr:radical SAM family heme chaperone HemW [Wolinella succinogenes]CAE10747.1 OXYGEN-INDEPENDENT COPROPORPHYRINOGEN III OXIDASE (HEMN) [Wolinella succinogenes]VEG80898.1 Oxygen-independent coproporphyrinogen-III oxidase [Wolinella succinogenes]HCZ18575.1 coproporphyrinogen III oxidase family protein [Helicobacter sp.]
MLLYFHIPFCASKCGYCAFDSRSAPSSWHAPYMQALLVALKSELAKLKEERIESVYFGGGTPTLLDSHLFEPLFERFSPYLSKEAEITIEANPRSLTPSWAERMHSFGVNRVSLGVQSFERKKLAWLERDHGEGEIERAMESLLKARIKHISIDLIYDTPLDSPTLLSKEIQRASTLPIDHLSAYSLTLEEGSRFFAKGQKGMEGESYASLVRERLGEDGFVQYEVSNYARGYRSSHNLGYWMAKDYIGVGAGAVGCLGGVRYYPAKEIERYIKEPLWREEEPLSHEDKRLERLFLGLRSEVGIAPHEANRSKLELLLSGGKVREERGRILANDLFLADEIALYLS